MFVYDIYVEYIRLMMISYDDYIGLKKWLKLNKF